LSKSVANVDSGSSGSMVASLKISLRRGNSPLEGVTAESRTAKYYWSPVSQLNLSPQSHRQIRHPSLYMRIFLDHGVLSKPCAHDTRTKTRRRKPVPENWYHKPARQ